MTASARQILPSGPWSTCVHTAGFGLVFVEIGRAAGSAAYEDDAATLGTSSAYSTVVQRLRVTAVGEVPPETVRVIARASITPDRMQAPGIGSGTADATAGVAHGLFPTADSSGPPAAAGPVRGFGAETPASYLRGADFSAHRAEPHGRSGRR